MPYSVVGLLAVPALLLSLGMIVWMAVSLARKKDERRRYIAARAGLDTLVILAAALAVCAVRNAVERDGAAWTLDPFALLAGIAVLFMAELFCWKRRCGG